MLRFMGMAVFVSGALTVFSLAEPKDDPTTLRRVVVGDGIELHYRERGQGVPVVFVHGSLSDGSYWNPQLAPFAEHYRAIAYSRRYNWPNHNPIRPRYSAAVDAEDLAALIHKLQLGKVHVIGHSYGALTALFLAARHPELTRTIVLAEAPVIPLLGHLHAERADIGRKTLADIRERMVKPMKAAFQKGDREAGVRAFLTYVLRDPSAWDRMPDSARADTLRNAVEWDAMMTTGELFPEILPQAIRDMKVPTLLLSGEKSYPFLRLIDDELEYLLPKNRSRHVVLRGATHRMWFEQPQACRDAVFAFWRDTEGR